MRLKTSPHRKHRIGLQPESLCGGRHRDLAREEDVHFEFRSVAFPLHPRESTHDPALRADVVEFDFDEPSKSIRILRTWLAGESVYNAA